MAFIHASTVRFLLYWKCSKMAASCWTSTSHFLKYDSSCTCNKNYKCICFIITKSSNNYSEKYSCFYHFNPCLLQLSCQRYSLTARRPALLTSVCSIVWGLRSRLDTVRPCVSVSSSTSFKQSWHLHLSVTLSWRWGYENQNVCLRMEMWQARLLSSTVLSQVRIGGIDVMSSQRAYYDQLTSILTWTPIYQTINLWYTESDQLFITFLLVDLEFDCCSTTRERNALSLLTCGLLS